MIDFDMSICGAGSPDAYVCRIAMTRCPGRPLDEWLGRRREAATRSPWTVPSIAAQWHGTGSCGSDDVVGTYFALFGRAVMDAYDMLVQLGPILARLNERVAIHRDVNERNIMVDDSYGNARQINDEVNRPRPRFSLIDFGSSIDVRAWRGGDNERAWRSSGQYSNGFWAKENPTGDAKFWCPGSWMRFVGKADDVIQAGLAMQYVERLDLFALAICALRIIFSGSVACGACNPENSFDDAFANLPGDSSCKVALVRLVRLASVSWAAYWEYVEFACSLLATYSRHAQEGDQDRTIKTWQELVNSNIANNLRVRSLRVVSDLAALRNFCLEQCNSDALRQTSLRQCEMSIAGPCPAVPTPSAPPLRSTQRPSRGLWSCIAATLGVLKKIVHEGSVCEWSALYKQLAVENVEMFTGATKLECNCAILGSSFTHCGACRGAGMVFDVDAASDLKLPVTQYAECAARGHVCTAHVSVSNGAKAILGAAVGTRGTAPNEVPRGVFVNTLGGSPGGISVGPSVGAPVGALVGTPVGVLVGAPVGAIVDAPVKALVEPPIVFGAKMHNMEPDQAERLESQEFDKHTKPPRCSNRCHDGVVQIVHGCWPKRVSSRRGTLRH